MAEVRLDTPHACREELQRVSSAIATLTPDYTDLRTEFALIDEQNEIAEALATVQIASANPKLTATELKARVVKHITEDEGLAPIRQRRVVLAAQLEVLERRFRSLEKRMSAAQSALNDHQAEARATSVGQR